jgi:Ca-activated chloride channel family protein
MNIDANDPKWTAYALGEIKDEKERAEIESILAESPEMRRLVEEIRETAGFLKTELQAEPSISLTQIQRKRIEEKANAGKSWFGLRPSWIMATAAAAVLMISIIAIRQVKKIPSNDEIASYIQKEPVPTQLPEIEITADTKTPEAPTTAAKGRVKGETHAVTPPVKDEFLKKVEDAVVVSAAVPTQLTESSSSVGAVLPQEKPKEQPLVGKDAMQQVNVMGGVVKPENTIFGNPSQTFAGVEADNINTTRDGISANDARYSSGIASTARLNPEAVGEFKMVLAPVDAEMARGHFNKGKRQRGDFNTEAYENIIDNPFLDVTQNPLSTFSIDVDTASYSNVRRFLDSGSLPPKDAVRIEELVNYFDYDYKGPKNDKPFAAHFEITEAPWKPEHKLLRIGLKGREIAPGKRPDSNLVFLLDVSGSMADENKLPLVKQSMNLLVDQLTESDRVAIVVYAGDTRVHLSSTSGDQKEKLRHAIERLHAGGSTSGASGIQLAYQTAKENFIQNGVNRVILATDGDFNVGITNHGDLARLIEEKAKGGIFLSALGFGMGNYKDSTLELLANKGRGNYAYIDTLNEAKKVLVEQINSTLVTIAKDVKIQVEFNPRRVSSYRLIGYEDRLMAKEDFNDDAKQAGVIGAGHAVTALYELVPVGVSESKPGVDPLKYQTPSQPSTNADSDELLTVKIRSKEPEKDKSVLSEFSVKESKEKFNNASQDFRFAASVAAFGMVLRDSPFKGNADLERALEWAKSGKGEDRHGYRQEFIRLIHRAISISY